MTKQDFPMNRPTRGVQKLFLAAAVMVVVITVTSAPASDDGRTPYAIGLWGDLPYNSAQATVGVPNLNC